MSPNAQKNKIEILNPVGDSRFTSVAGARRLVDRGRADWVNERGTMKILLNENHRAIRAGIALSAILVRRGEGGGMATLDGVRHLPVAGPAIRVFTGKRQTEPVFDHSTIELSRRMVTSL